jgi:hypothetical protein
MKKFVKKLIIVVLLINLIGCGVSKVVSRSSPRYKTMENDYYYLSLTPLSTNNRHCGFRLILKNKTTNTLIVDWDNAHYTHNGNQQGGFIYDGLNYDNRNDIRLPDTVIGRDIFIKTIWPVVLAKGERDQYTQAALEPGEHGIELTIVVDGQIFREKLSVNISVKED